MQPGQTPPKGYSRFIYMHVPGAMKPFPCTTRKCTQIVTACVNMKQDTKQTVNVITHDLSKILIATNKNMIYYSLLNYC